MAQIVPDLKFILTCTLLIGQLPVHLERSTSAGNLLRLFVQLSSFHTSVFFAFDDGRMVLPSGVTSNRTTNANLPSSTLVCSTV